MEASSLKVTVAIPIYNAARHLNVTLDSLLNQTMDPSEFEVICVNDRSTDNSKEVIENYQKEMSNLILIDRNENSGGPMIPRNDAIESARGEYIMFLDNDDFLGEETLERLYSAAKENHSDVIYGKYVGVNGRKVPQSMFQKGNRPNADIIADNLVYSLAPHKMFHLGFIRENQFRFHPKAVVGEDQLFVMQCYIKAKVITVMADYDYYFVVARGNENLSLKYFPAEQFYFSFNHIMEFIQESNLNTLYKTELTKAFLNRFLKASRLRNYLLSNRLTREQKIDWLNETKRFFDHYVPDQIIDSLQNRFKYFVRVAKENDIDKLLLIHKQIQQVTANDVTRVQNGFIYARLLRVSKNCSYDEEHVVNQFNTSNVFITKMALKRSRFILKGQFTQSLLINFDQEMVYTLKLVHRKTGIEKFHTDNTSLYGGFEFNVDYKEILFNPELTGIWDLFVEASVGGYIKRRRIGSSRSFSMRRLKKVSIIRSFGHLYSIQPFLTDHNNISFEVKKRI
ncbi:glycosyltransferase family 2 protein [Sporolactobacillus sp. THM7-4]|nr:glycosyltransferase family 2 protein [Sporolactobacillus sp. THM7-4]